jgi:hypothetical protein
MWLGPDGSQYVLDGGHRISVLIAWIKDDWGDKLPSEAYKDKILEGVSKAAAQRVRELLKESGIGFFADYDAADARYEELERQLGHKPGFGEMDADSLRYAEMVRRWEGVNIGFPILWVRGDYAKAEESFLKINKTGRQLSDWETKLVENRTSSFARTVMSIAQLHDAEHCWPMHDDDVKNDPDFQQKAATILERVRGLHELLFTPDYETPIRRAEQPLLATPYTKPEMKPAYLAELLTIVEGKKGQKPETEALIKRDKHGSARDIINGGLKLVNNAMDVLSNIYGGSPRSLMLMPLVYFYNEQGIYVRSLLYGMLYWLNHGSENRDILDRKRLFAAHRGTFETVLLQHKNTIISRIARRIGSGSEVTYPTARYFDGLLRIIIEHKDAIDSPAFQAAHETLIETLGVPAKRETIEEVTSARLYKGRKRDEVNVKDVFNAFQLCEICGGRYLPGLFTQVDHKKRYADGGKTTLENARNTHPFCNNNRDVIEALRADETQLELPAFEKPKEEQMSFLSLWDNEHDGDERDPVEEAEAASMEEPGTDSNDFTPAA